MLRSFRDNIKGGFGKVVLGLIIVAFVGFGAADIIINRGGGSDVLEVNGVVVDELTFAQEMQFTRNRLINQMGENIRYEDLADDKLAPIARERLIRRLLVAGEGDALNMAIPEAIVEQSIVSTPAFMVDGKFSSEQMNLILADNGFNLSAFKKMLVDDMRSVQFQSGLQGSGFVSDWDVNLMVEVGSETRTIDWVLLGRDEYRDRINIDDAEIEAYYADHRDELMTQFSVDVEYILLKADDFRPEISEAEVQQEYERMAAQYEAVESRRVAHILLEISNEQPLAVAQALAKDIKQRADQGESFAALAREFSQDSGSAKDGGDLGYAEQDGSYPEPFEAAVFALAKNVVSDPVQTDAGIHLIQVSDIQTSEMTPLVEQRDFIVDQLQRSAATRQFVSVSEKLADQVFNADGLQSTADALDLVVNRVNQVTREGVILSDNTDSVAMGMFRDQRLLQVMFADEVLEERLNSELIEIDAETRIVLRVAGTHAPRQLTLKEAAPRIRERVEFEKLAQAVEADVATISESVASGADFAAAAKEQALELVKATTLTRRSSDIDPVLLEAVFSTARSEIGTVLHKAIDSKGDSYLFQLKAIETSGDSLSASERDMLAQQAQSLVSQQEFSAFWQAVRQNAQIVEY